MTFNYYLIRDKVKREIVPSQGYGYVDLSCYALNVTKSFQKSETWTFREAFKRKKTNDG